MVRFFPHRQETRGAKGVGEIVFALKEKVVGYQVFQLSVLCFVRLSEGL